jgi:hypothetical protein
LLTYQNALGLLSTAAAERISVLSKYPNVADPEALLAAAVDLKSADHTTESVSKVVVMDDVHASQRMLVAKVCLYCCQKYNSIFRKSLLWFTIFPCPFCYYETQVGSLNIQLCGAADVDASLAREVIAAARTCMWTVQHTHSTLTLEAVASLQLLAAREKVLLEVRLQLFCSCILVFFEKY